MASPLALRRMSVARSDDVKGERFAGDPNVAAMHRLLDEMSPATTSDALSALRDAFPDVSLALRVHALSVRRH